MQSRRPVDGDDEKDASAARRCIVSLIKTRGVCGAIFYSGLFIGTMVRSTWLGVVRHRCEVTAGEFLFDY